MKVNKQRLERQYTDKSGAGTLQMMKAGSAHPLGLGSMGSHL